jgi:hypothetical protein
VPKSKIHGIWNDQQIPYHDPRALDVATQIFIDAKINRLIYNGDWGDYLDLGTHPKGDRDELYIGIEREVQEQRDLLHECHKAINPDEADWNDGNHEWRVQRAFWKDPKLAAKVLKIKYTEMQLIGSVKEAISIPAILGLDKLKIRYSGPYPNGCWLRKGVEEQDNVYVHHGYTARKKAGYTVSGQMDDHWCSQIVGHCERLAGPIWNRKLGRDFFGIENGNLSLIGEPDKGDGIYAGIPHSQPRLMNHRQGITVIYEEGGHVWPFTIRIRDGKAHWGGKLYKA